MSKSQWDFGELFPTEATRKVLSVSELTTQVKRLLEKQIGSLWVSGEVTNLRAQSSGHIYFTLKDAGAQLSCVLFSRENVPHRELLADGQKVLLQGNVTVYEARGQYQLIVRAVELQGVGALQVAFEKLKAKLAAEGLFAPERKRPLPKYPQRIGLVTSPTGAAIRDVLHVVQRRNPGMEIILAPCRVQGQGAAEEIAAAVASLNRYSVASASIQRFDDSTKLDLILVTRGGGSLEDLWSFNEEVVARAIFNSAIPVVSAVGHEIDFTISDFVADFRAATPSAAAEIITEDVFASREFVADAPELLRRIARRGLQSATDIFSQLGARLVRLHPRRRLDESLQRLDDLQSGLLRCVKQVARDRRSRLDNLQARLRLLGPEQVLARGYSITMDAATGKVLRRAQDAKAGQKLRTRVSEGEIRSKVD